jgi:hypothetical protein
LVLWHPSGMPLGMQFESGMIPVRADVVPKLHLQAVFQNESHFSHITTDFFLALFTS